MHHLTINDLNFFKEATDADELFLEGGWVPSFSASTNVQLATKVVFNASINYRTGAEYSAGLGYAGGYAAAASINGRSTTFLAVNVY